MNNRGMWDIVRNIPFKNAFEMFFIEIKFNKFNFGHSLANKQKNFVELGKKRIT